jgi:nucleotide-binding universal stress UspA family protein
MEVLVAIESSPSSFKALEHAVHTVKREGGSLTVLTVAEMILDLEEIFDYNILHEKLLQKATSVLESAKTYCQSQDVKAQYKVLEGQSPANAILEYAENAPVDLLVVGSRSKKGLDKFLLGSIASKIVSHAKCSVLVVR